MPNRSVLLPVFALVLAAALAACSGQSAPPEATPVEPLALITEAAARIRAVDTFRLDVNQEGPDYLIGTVYANVLFRRATAQYVAPGVMQADVSVIEPITGLRIDVGVYADGADQWYRAIWTGNTWVNEAFAAGFNPEALIAEDTGFNAALNAVIDLAYVGETALESGVQVHHITGRARGEDVNALLVGLIETVGEVGVEVYVAKDTLYPVRFVITEENSPYAVTPEPGEPAEPVVWIMDLYAINEPAQLDVPRAESTAESTAESETTNAPFLGAGGN
ncbi:MAG: LppX_LprAFG lipoprotein [bacterium]|nr:LppX_LprAFG lipoprotein [bacterium]